MQRRFAIIKLLAPYRRPVLQTPLAVCDARTIDPGDLLSSDLVYPDWIGDVRVAFNPRHRWYWFPARFPPKQRYSKSTTQLRRAARLTAHTAFDDPSKPSQCPSPPQHRGTLPVVLVIPEQVARLSEGALRLRSGNDAILLRASVGKVTRGKTSHNVADEVLTISLLALICCVGSAKSESPDGSWCGAEPGSGRTELLLCVAREGHRCVPMAPTTRAMCARSWGGARTRLASCA